MTGDGADRTPGTAIDPPEWFRSAAAVSNPEIYERFERDWPDCWARAGDLLDWEREYETAFRGGDTPPFEWFPGGELNAS
ncbi:acetyl-coenzyme A synthetase N-terminal domain-containing protein, partial [Halolamina salina]